MINFDNHVRRRGGSINLTLDQLEAVHAIVEKGSFRAAADYLNRSQPAISASVKNLEEEFSIQIFDRQSYRPTLTETGTIFLNASRATLEAARYANRIAKELGQKKAETKVRLAVDPLTPIDAIEMVALECGRPVVPVVLILDKTILQSGRALLLEGVVDLAIGPCPSDEAALERIVIASVSLIGVVSRKLLQERKMADRAFLDRHAQILVYDRLVDEPDGLSAKELYEGNRPKIFAPDHFTKLQLIEGGVGWGRLTQAEFEATAGLVQIDRKLCSILNLELCMMRPRHREIGPIARRIWAVFLERYEKV